MLIKYDAEHGLAEIRFDNEEDCMLCLNEGKICLELIHCARKPEIIEEQLAFRLEEVKNGME